MSDNLVYINRAKDDDAEKPLAVRLDNIINKYEGQPSTEPVLIALRNEIVDCLLDEQKKNGYIICAACQMQTTLDRFLVDVVSNGACLDVMVQHNQEECLPRQQMHALAKARQTIPAPTRPGEAKDAADLELLIAATQRMNKQLMNTLFAFREKYGYPEVLDQSSSQESIRTAMMLSECDEIIRRQDLIHTHVRYLQVLINSR